MHCQLQRHPLTAFPYLAVFPHVIHVLIYRLNVDPLSLALPVSDVIVTKSQYPPGREELPEGLVKAEVFGEAVADEGKAKDRLARDGP